MRLKKSVFAIGKFCQMQLAKCKMQNGMQLQIESSLTCSYLQTTSSHFVPRLVSPSKSKILFEEMSKIWQSPKLFADAVPKYKGQHPCNLNMKQICCWIHDRFKVICQFAKQIWTTNNVPNTHQANFASRRHIIQNCQHPIFLSHCCAKFGRFNKVPSFDSCNFDGVFANLWRIHCLQWHSTDLARTRASMPICSSDLGLQLQVRFDSYLAQLSLQRLCMPQQDLPFGDKSLTFVTRHYTWSRLRNISTCT